MFGLGMFGEGNKDKWQTWRDSLSQLSDDISNLPPGEEKDALKQHADALYNALMDALPRLNTPAFDKAYCDAMAWIGAQHIRIHHGIVPVEFGGEYLGDSGGGF